MLLKNKHILKEKERNTTKMVATRIRFTSLVLLGLFFVMMHALRDFSAYAHQGKERNGNGFAASEENYFMYVPKENVGGGTPAAATSEIGIGGRKMARVHKVWRKKETTEKELQGLIAVNNGGATTQISGNINDASKKSFRRSISQNQLNDQSKFNMLEPKKTQDHPAHDDQKDEAQRLLLEEAANNEIVNLMHKDYKGMGRPRRKPPVNNHEPSD